MQHIHTPKQINSLSSRIKTRHALNRLCTEAIHRQIELGETQATHLRNRRRYLARQILKRIPHACRLAPKKLLHAAAMVLSMWGFGGMPMPNQADAAPVFVAVTGVNNPLNGIVDPYNSTPTFVDIDNDGDLDLFVGNGGFMNSVIRFYRNTGTKSAPNFVAVTGVNNPLNGVAFKGPLGNYATPAFGDIDGDSDLDAFVGERFGSIYFYRNTGTKAAPVFQAVTGVNNPMNNTYTRRAPAPAFIDIDHDGDLDAFVGTTTVISYFRNQGSATAPQFVGVTGALNPLNSFIFYTPLSTPAFADLDHDGDFDVLVGSQRGTLSFLRNTGSSTVPTFTELTGVNNPMNGVDVGSNSAPAFADIDNDGDPDLFVGESTGTILFFKNADPSPVTAPDSITTVSDIAASSGDVTANDAFKLEGPIANFTITAFTQGSSGTVTNNGNNTFTYTPNAGFIGADSFTYTLNDGIGNTATGIVDVTVNVNNPPAPSAPAIITNEDTPTVSQVSPNDPDAGDTHAYAVTSVSINSTATVDATGLVTYMPDPNFNGSDSVFVMVTDVAGNSATVTINATVNPVNDPPAPSAPAIITNEDTPATTQVMHNDPDAGDSHVYAVTSVSINSVATVDATGLVSYAPGPNFNGTDSFTVQVTDAAGATGSVTVPVTVNPVNDAPAPSAPIITTNAGVSGSSQVFPNDPDVGDTHAYAVTKAAANGVTGVDAAGLATYRPNAGFSGADSFVVTATDNGTPQLSGAVTVRVTVNAPAASTFGLSLNASAFITGDTLTLSAAVLASIPPIHADAYVALQLPDGTLLVMQPGGSFSTALTPFISNIAVPNFSGSIFNYTFSGTEPVGTYTWFAALTTPGTLNVIGTMTMAPFSFAP